MQAVLSNVKAQEAVQDDIQKQLTVSLQETRQITADSWASIKKLEEYSKTITDIMSKLNNASNVSLQNFNTIREKDALLHEATDTAYNSGVKVREISEKTKELVSMFKTE